jgi:hypothetical protein
MSATCIQTRPGAASINSIDSCAWFEKLSEYFWCSLCLILFVVLGPFSAPIALGVVLFSNLQDPALPEPDSVYKQ